MFHLQLTGTHSLIFEIVVTTVVIVILIILLYIFRYLKQIYSNTQINVRRGNREDINITNEVYIMLKQHGKVLTQKEIANNLKLPQHIVAQKLLEMEDNELIVREWDKDEFRYSARPQK